jgi:alpha-glucosidase (family GH31 glycosyl hydrolase)
MVGLFKELISDIGKGVWNDMNEPAVMEVPKKHSLWMFVMIMTEIHAVIERAHNIYGTQMARATYHGEKDLLTRKGLYYHKICLCGGATLQFLLDRR